MIQVRGWPLDGLGRGDPVSGRDLWGLVLTYGLLTFGLGVVLAVWPDETLTVCAVLIGIQFLVSGVLRVVIAVAGSGVDGAGRALVGLSGAVALVVGLLCLRDPLQTLVVIGIIVGAWWLVSGVVDILQVFLSPTPGQRGWDLVVGAISVVGGGILLANPEVSLGLLVIIVSVWLLAVGLIAIVSALRMRATHRAEPSSSDTVLPPAPAG